MDAAIELVERMIDIREESGMTQYELAAKIGVSPERIRAIEAGTREPRLFEFLDILSALGNYELRFVERR